MIDSSEIQNDKLSLFNQKKRSILEREDLSLKASIDEPIRSTVDLINSSPYYCTTSTCSGRVTIIEKFLGASGKKQNSKFHLRSHDKIYFNDVNPIVRCFLDDQPEDNQCLWLKYEPFIAHILCSSLETAKLIMTVAINSGCRNSGITFTKNDNGYLAAIRSTSSMEIPICCGQEFDPDENFIRFLCEESNRRMSANLERLDKFHKLLRETLENKVI